MSDQNNHSTAKRSHKREYFLINVFTFTGIGLILFCILNLPFFHQFKLAFKDFSLTDVYYSKMQTRDSIYGGPLALVNIENRTGPEIAFLIHRIQEGAPKVVGSDVLDGEFINQDILLKETLGSYTNLVVPTVQNADTINAESSYVSSNGNDFLKQQEKDREFSTVRSYYRYYKSKPAFTTAILHKYDAAVWSKPKGVVDEKKDIRFWGNVQHFKNYSFEEIMDPAFDLTQIKDKIILIGNLSFSAAPDEDDRFYTPLNEHVAGRTHPDMSGLVVHANILRMALDKDHIMKVPTWLNWTLAFLICWMMVPLFVKCYVYKPMWYHLFAKLTQVGITILFVYITILLYAKANIKIEAASILIPVLLLGEFVLFWDGVVKSLRLKTTRPFHSIYFEGHGH